MDTNYEQQLEQLFKERANITTKINELMLKKYQKYKDISDKVESDNPYSRLMALKRMGVVKNYEKIREFCVIIVGVGGVGSVVAEMMTRCGIGKLILYDYDKVELANMNRLFFTPQQVGLTKTDAAKETLQFINPQIIIESYNMNITTQDGYAHLKDRILNGGIQNNRTNLVLSCVDNYSARMSINMLCNDLKQHWFESGVSEDAMSSHIQLMVPGETACFACATPLAVVEENEADIKREGVCAASLPTTMGITAGFMSQNVLKYLLEFGEISYCLSYNAKLDFFNNYLIKPNPECKLEKCKLNQQQLNSNETQSYLKFRENLIMSQFQQNEEVKHENNDWGIEVVQEGQTQDTQQQVVIQQTSENVNQGEAQNQNEISEQDRQGQSLEDLMKKLKNM